MTPIIKGKPDPEREAYYVLVVGMRGPRKRHRDYDKALAEAKRLHAANGGRLRVYVLAPVATIDREESKEKKPVLGLPKKTKAPRVSP